MTNTITYSSSIIYKPSKIICFHKASQETIPILIPTKTMLKRKLLYALGLLVNSSLSLTIHSTSSSSIASPSVAHPLDDNTYFILVQPQFQIVN